MDVTTAELYGARHVDNHGQQQDASKFLMRLLSTWSLLDAQAADVAVGDAATRRLVDQHFGFKICQTGV